jgi:hypothetical protein
MGQAMTGSQTDKGYHNIALPSINIIPVGLLPPSLNLFQPEV